MEELSIISRGCYKVDSEKSRCRCTGGKLGVTDWLEGMPQTVNEPDAVEIKFKNTRKGFYRNVNQLNLVKGDIVAVEASPGHDIGVVCLTGQLVVEQMRRMGTPYTADGELKKVYRKAKQVDIEKWLEAISQEGKVMFEARDISARLNLNMKIGDVEFQGDRTKAIFYYIADERVDFRELIKVLAERFKIRVEMRQIGARQEAGRIGGIGSCGRELCCATWMSNFKSVATVAARIQELSLNPSKLAGQCGKLKCCLNYELDCYADKRRNYPSSDTKIQTREGTLFCQKTDIFKEIMWFSEQPDSALNMIALPVEKVWELIDLNKKGVMIDKANMTSKVVIEKDELDYRVVVGEESLTRFDDANKNKRNKNRQDRTVRKNGNQTTKKLPINTKNGANNPQPNGVAILQTETIVEEHQNTQNVNDEEAQRTKSKRKRRRNKNTSNNNRIKDENTTQPPIENN